MLNKINDFFAKIPFGNIGKINLHFDIHSPLCKFIVLILFILVISFFIDYLLSRSIFGKNYRIFVAPGIILHELSHAVMCLFTGAKISKISLFDKEGGKVEHLAPKVTILGQILISLAPFAFGVAAIFFLSKWLGIGEIDITKIEIIRDNGILKYLTSALSNLSLHGYKSWIIVYLVLSISITLTPSVQDLRNIFLSISVIFILLFLAFKFFPSAFIFSFVIPSQIIVLLSTVSFLLILGLLLSIILYMIGKIARK